jgi:hypothetical protein
MEARSDASHASILATAVIKSVEILKREVPRNEGK